MKKINNITDKTTVTATTGQNKTIFTIDVGLHLKDVDIIQSAILHILNNGCEKTRQFIDDFNADLPEEIESDYRPDKCEKPNCRCVEIAESKNGGNPVKSCPCLAKVDTEDMNKEKVKVFTANSSKQFHSPLKKDGQGKR